MLPSSFVLFVRTIASRLENSRASCIEDPEAGARREVPGPQVTCGSLLKERPVLAARDPACRVPPAHPALSSLVVGMHFEVNASPLGTGASCKLADAFITPNQLVE